jgi:hypothetical protein
LNRLPAAVGVDVGVDVGGAHCVGGGSCAARRMGLAGLDDQRRLFVTRGPRGRVSVVVGGGFVLLVSSLKGLCAV